MGTDALNSDINNKTRCIVDPFADANDGFLLGPRPLTAWEIMCRLSTEKPTGGFLVAEFQKWISDKQPLDRYGYPFVTPPALESWRKHRVDKLAYCLRTIAEMAEERREYV